MTKQSYPLIIDGVKLPGALDAASSFTLMLALECDAPVDLSALALFAALCFWLVIAGNFGLFLLDFLHINCLKVALK